MPQPVYALKRTASRSARRAYTTDPDQPAPSWGQGLLYEHVRLLREEGFDAWVLHERAPFRLPWLESDVPVAYLDDGGPGRAAAGPDAGPDDLLVVPENLVARTMGLPWPGRRGVFVQGSFLTLVGQPQAFRYPELGYDFAIAVLPHVARVVASHFGIEPLLVPPFIAPYFFRSPTRSRARARTSCCWSAGRLRQVGFPDYASSPSCAALLRRAAGGWRVEGCRTSRTRSGAAHGGVRLLVNLNSHEAFNSTVPEAMAAGCAVLCYEAVGGRDFLVDGKNAFVFANHHVYELVERLQRLIVRGDKAADLGLVRAAARQTAGQFEQAATRRALAEAFASLLAPRLV